MTASHELALSPDGRTVGYRPDSSDSWWTFPVPTKGDGYLADLPEGWIRYAPATSDYLLSTRLERVADELEAAGEELGFLRRKLLETRRSERAGCPDGDRVPVLVDNRVRVAHRLTRDGAGCKAPPGILGATLATQEVARFWGVTPCSDCWPTNPPTEI